MLYFSSLLIPVEFVRQKFSVFPKPIQSYSFLKSCELSDESKDPVSVENDDSFIKVMLSEFA